MLRLYLQYFTQAESSAVEDIRYQEDFTELVLLSLMRFLNGLKFRLQETEKYMSRDMKEEKYAILLRL